MCTPFIGCYAEESIHLELIALDGWTFFIHSNKRGREHSAESTKHFILFSNAISADKQEAFWKIFNESFEKAHSNDGSKRSTVGNKNGGHQKTPAFIAGIIANSCSILEGNDDTEVNQSRGSTTDVGLHTGGKARDTAFPLVLATLHECIKKQDYAEPEKLISNIDFYFSLWLLQRQIVKTKVNITSLHIDVVMRMLDVTVKKSLKLISNGWAHPYLEDTLTHVKSQLESLRTKTLQTNQYLLPIEKLSAESPKLRDFKLSLPGSNCIDYTITKLSKVIDNLNALPLMIPNSIYSINSNIFSKLMLSEKRLTPKSDLSKSI